MASTEEKVNCVLWLAELKSTIAVQRKFRVEYNKEPPHRNTITKWMKNFKETGSIHDKPQSGRHVLGTKVLHPQKSPLQQVQNSQSKKSVKKSQIQKQSRIIKAQTPKV